MMMLAKSKILFISHDATRTGAPILLLNFLKWLKKNSDFTFEVLLRNPGPLVEEFAEIAPVRIVHHQHSLISLIQVHGKKRGLRYWIKEMARRLKPASTDPRAASVKKLVSYYSKFKPDLVYSNTVVNGDLLEAFSGFDCPVISHIHELDNIISVFGEKNWQSVKRKTGQFITASTAVKENLVLNRSVDASLIDVVYSFVITRQGNTVTSESNALRNKLGIPEEAFVVCGSGLDEWRKGTDLFIRCASSVNKRKSDSAHFLWVGGWLSEQARKEHLELAARLQVADRTTFTGMVDNPLDYFALASVFILTSREDPFPLVCLEAASMGIPIMCFAEAGGMPVFVEEDAGSVLPFGDFSAMAEKIIELIENPSLRNTLGARAREKVKERYDIEVGSQKILGIINRVLDA